MTPGKFIVIEGLDGSGKTTQVNFLASALKRKGKKTVVTFEPTKGRIGQLIDYYLKKKVVLPPASLQLLFVADRLAHVQSLIKPALKEGKIVISDRFSWSTVAYGSISGLDSRWLLSLHRYCLIPDLFIFLKVKPEICLRRISKREEVKELFEKKEKLHRAEVAYDFLRQSFVDKTILVDGERTPQAIAKEIEKKVFNYFGF